MTDLVTTEEKSDLQELFSESQIALVKTTLMPGSTNEELNFFGAICKRTKLDPFARQIFPVPRNTKNWKTGQYETKWSFQTSVDGFRLIAERSNKYEGQTPTQWCGKDGEWVDVWLENFAPSAARVGVYKKNHREATYAVAKFSSYCQIDKSGNPSGLWKKMPEVMIAKCAECLAIRKCFPNDVQGLYAEEEMHQETNYEPKQTMSSLAEDTANAVEEAPHTTDAVIETEASPVENKPEPQPEHTQSAEDYVITDKQRKRMFAIAKANNYDEKDIKGLILAATGQDSSKGLKKSAYDDICTKLGG